MTNQQVGTVDIIYHDLKVSNTREKVVKMRFKEWTWCCNKSLANPPPSATKILCVALT